MGIVNLTDLEKQSLQAIDVHEMDRLIEKAIQEENALVLNGLPLHSCGEYVRTELYRFEQALRELRAAKSNKKREEALYRVQRAREPLSGSVYGMKHRMAEDEKEAELFRVNDHVFHPHSFFDRTLEVRVSYEWRRSKDDEEWKYGAITFTHEVLPQRPRYPQTAPKKKPSASKQRHILGSA
ncbi:hypothetical protein [Mesorhizobium sophorae]|uniref:hypothetical protein n=1 Tax=Mesorhizobium sophorae TaxID=1300294 RepID=UPI0011814BA2|nr:hypothetical protein [Mesorhizobium sophorae]